jgi:hypothetical protein
MANLTSRTSTKVATTSTNASPKRWSSGDKSGRETSRPRTAFMWEEWDREHLLL